MRVLYRPVSCKSRAFSLIELLIVISTMGLLIGMLQAATQIQEMTLSFIPKMIGMGAALLFAGPWMLAMLVEFTEGLYERIPFLLG